MWTLRQAQLDALAARTFEEVLARVAGTTAREFPEVRRALKTDYVPWVRELLEAGVALDITLEENLQQFVAWHARVGVRTSLVEEFPWVYDMLGVRGEHESDRVAAVEARMQGFDDEGDTP